MEFDVLAPDFSQAADLDANRSSRRQTARRAIVWVSTRIAASPERVFDAWVDPRVAGKWLFATASRPMTHVAIDARVRGRFRFAGRDDEGPVEHRGAYIEIIRPRRLVFSLSAARALPATRVVAEIAPAAVAASAGKNPGPSADLMVTHEGIPADYAARIEARWTGILYGLGLTLDT